MSPDDWQRVKELFEAAQSQPARRRARWLAAACDQQHIREEVESLLAANESAGEFIQKSPAEEIAEAVAGLAPRNLAGQRVGSWRLIEEIGQGGMGTVGVASVRTAPSRRRWRSNWSAAAWTPT